MKFSPRRTIACKCGSVKVELVGSPIMVNVCHCVGCQRGSAQLEGLPGASKVLDAYGGTPYVLWRKDRIRLLRGRELLRDLRREGEKDTRRVVASCCNSPVLLDFEPGHWVSIYQQRFDAPVPQARMRIQTRSMQPAVRAITDGGLYSMSPVVLMSLNSIFRNAVFSLKKLPRHPETRQGRRRTIRWLAVSLLPPRVSTQRGHISHLCIYGSVTAHIPR